MGNYILSPVLNFMWITLFFLCFLCFSVSSHSSNREISQSRYPSSPSFNYQVFQFKNIDPMFLMTTQERVNVRRKIRTKKLKQGKKMVKNMQSSRTFSVMLPKGFVPPSGSSPCHNDQPNSVSFHCHLARASEP